jgi:hypothetical protein
LVGHLDCHRLFFQTVEYLFHSMGNDGINLAKLRIELHSTVDLVEMFLRIAWQLQSVFGPFDARKYDAFNISFMPAQCRDSKMRPVTDAPQTYLLRTECFSQIVDIICIFVRVVTQQIDAACKETIMTRLTKGTVKFERFFTRERLIWGKREFLCAIRVRPDAPVPRWSNAIHIADLAHRHEKRKACSAEPRRCPNRQGRLRG